MLHSVEAFPSHRCVFFSVGLFVPPVVTSHLTTVTTYTSINTDFPLKHAASDQQQQQVIYNEMKTLNTKLHNILLNN